MIEYSDTVLDHCNNPRNVGSWPKDDLDVGTAVVRESQCGDVLKLQLRVDRTTGLIDARFKTFGCAAAIASGSLVTEWLKGSRLEQALSIKSADIVEELGLPPGKVHASALAEEAVAAAVADYRGKRS